MSGHSSRWSYQMGPLSEPHLQQAPLTSAATSPVATQGLEPAPSGRKKSGGMQGYKGAVSEVRAGRVGSALDDCP